MLPGQAPGQRRWPVPPGVPVQCGTRPDRNPAQTSQPHHFRGTCRQGHCTPVPQCPCRQEHPYLASWQLRAVSVPRVPPRGRLPCRQESVRYISCAYFFRSPELIDIYKLHFKANSRIFLINPFKTAKAINNIKYCFLKPRF